MRSYLLLISFCLFVLSGCGTTKWSDTSRTATEQLLISDAIDRAVSRIDFRAVAGKKVFLDTSPISQSVDSSYLTSLLRQHMLASGCVLMPAREQADYIVEVRSGAIGTDRREVLFGVPATRVGGVVTVPGVPESVPEIPLAKNTEQRAIAKIAVYAYHRQTGRPVWQSGVMPVESRAKDIWVLGAGPFQRGSIYEGTKFVGSKIKLPMTPKKDGKKGAVSVSDEAFFSDPEEEKAKEQQLAKASSKPKAAAASGGAKAGAAKGADSVAKQEAQAAGKEAAVAKHEAPAAAKNEVAGAPSGVVPATHTAPVDPPAQSPPPAESPEPPAPAPPADPGPIPPSPQPNSHLDLSSSSGPPGKMGLSTGLDPPMEKSQIPALQLPQLLGK